MKSLDNTIINENHDQLPDKIHDERADSSNSKKHRLFFVTHVSNLITDNIKTIIILSKPINRTIGYHKCSRILSSYFFVKHFILLELFNTTIKKKFNLNQKYAYGLTFLHMAVLINEYNLVKLLLYNKAKPNLKDQQNRTPLYFASFIGNEGIVRSLLVSGANPNLRSKRLNSCLHAASFRGNTETIRLLIRAGAMLNSRTRKYKSSALHLAVYYKHIEIVDFLASEGANPDIRNRMGSSPLMNIIYSENIALVNLLLKHGANINVRNNRGENLLNIAVTYNKKSTFIKSLIDSGADLNNQDNKGWNPLIIAASRDHFEICKILVRNRTDLNMQNIYGETALMFAVRYRNYNAVKLLLQYGADPNIRNEDGTTALHWAACNDDVITIKLLLNNKANINLKDKNGYNAFLYNTMQKHNKCIKLLIKQGVDLNSQNIFKENAAFLATKYNNYKLLKYLISMGIDINAFNYYGESPLHIAIKSFNTKIVNLLLKKGSNTNAKDEELETPLHLSISIKNIAIIRSLLKFKANLFDKNKLGNSILHGCVVYENSYVIKKILAINKSTLYTKSYLGFTPIDYAIRFYKIDIIKLFIKHGYKPDLRTAILFNDIEGIKKLLKARVKVNFYDGFYSPLHYAIILGNPTIVKMLLQHGANIHALSHKKESALYLGNGNKEIISILKEFGANTIINYNIPKLMHWNKLFYRSKQTKIYFNCKGIQLEQAVIINTKKLTPITNCQKLLLFKALDYISSLFKIKFIDTSNNRLINLIFGIPQFNRISTHEDAIGYTEAIFSNANSAYPKIECVIGLYDKNMGNLYKPWYKTTIYTTILHEMGHFLGLNHPNDEKLNNFDTTIMCEEFPHFKKEVCEFFPEFTLLDLEALSTMYEPTELCLRTIETLKSKSAYKNNGEASI